ncbi:carboxymuconolactone decarboxylase family protein [Leeuwenhoekiella marinoflava]|uniref:Quercetin dioxygenase-like cupin family protein n=2 Tax=Leeuwenhoekiella marinoflava TaxID=988 RepID=A0A4Q0P802_9FLAO|nr:carboxymuconolactone decarboxylase family protein [Leeuwenhoekiella marinoflava]RXG21889.1 quercetin dioxygenase-like cupin family protein [Leeuwenhoekiella marinoflava]SHG01637.1 Cupin domain protein [Leeuwenhoekiella marinoflava DSM 3653]
MLTFYSLSFGSAYAQSKDELSPVEQGIASIAIATAKGDTPLLNKALHRGLDFGMTINQVKEELVHLYAYCGFPRSLMAINTLSEVLQERKAKGIQDQVGPAAIDLNAGNKYEIGKEVLADLTGVTDRPKAGYAETVPIIEIFLKEHLFADIFKRGVLNYKEREIATVGALLRMGDLDPMARGHMAIAMHQGVTEAQMKQIIEMVETQVGPEKAYIGKLLLAALTDSKEPTPSSALSEIENLIFPRGEKLDNPVFTGNAYLTSLITADEVNTTAAGVVTFEPGARTFWHQHPTGQIIITISGTGFYQEKGSPKRILKKGDAVKCLPNTPHWHGASDTEAFVQIAITDRSEGPTQWFDVVTKETYLSKK